MEQKTVENVLYSLWQQIRFNNGRYKNVYVVEATHYNIPNNVIQYVIEQANNKKRFYFETWPTAARMIREAKEGRMTFSEFFLSKVAYQAGYTDVYHNELPNGEESAIPGQWITDDTVVSDFANDHYFERVENEDGDEFILEGEYLEQFLVTFKEELKTANLLTVDELLVKRAKVSNN